MENKMDIRLINNSEASRQLGERRFLSAERVVSEWNKLIKEKRSQHSIAPIEISADLQIPYTADTLNEFSRDTGWYLIYDPGFSLINNRLIIGTDPSHPPCHREDNDWWLVEREQRWASKTESPGYYLVKMEGILTLDNAAKDWDWQDEQIKQMGKKLQRASTRVVVNAMVSCYLLNGEKHLDKYSFFGPEVDADWCLLVTGWDEHGINLGHWLRNDWGGYWGADLRVCLSYKYDIKCPS
jgi:hypothetical protein